MSKLVLEKLKERFPSSILETHSQHGDDTAVIAPEAWREVCAFLRDGALPLRLPMSLA